MKQHINVRTFTARLSDYRKQPATESLALIPVQIASADSTAATAPAVAAIVFTSVHGHRLELSPSVPVGWVAELLRYLA